MSIRREAVTLGVLTDSALVASGVPAMLRGLSARVRVLDVRGPAPAPSTVDVVLRDVDGGAVPLGAGWSARHEVDYGWPATPVPPPAGGPGVPCVPKTLEAQALAAAVEEIAETGAYAAPARPDVRPVEPDPEEWPGRDAGLTERESQIVVLIVAGLSNNELADRLYLGVNTVKTYIRSAYQRMGVHSRSQAVLWGIDHGMRRPEVYQRVESAAAESRRLAGAEVD